MTDASLWGWGAHFHTTSIGAQWLPPFRTLHINILELLATKLALLAFLPLIEDKVVAIFMDNSTARAYINRQGGTISRRLCMLAMEIWDWCIQHIFLIATHIPGDYNTQADLLSRGAIPLHDWEINPAVLLPIFL